MVTNGVRVRVSRVSSQSDRTGGVCGHVVIENLGTLSTISRYWIITNA